MIDSILAIVRWLVLIPALAIECILKSLVFIILSVSIFFMALTFPIFRHVLPNLPDSWIYKYAMKWRGNFPIAETIFSLWQ